MADPDSTSPDLSGEPGRERSRRWLFAAALGACSLLGVRPALAQAVVSARVRGVAFENLHTGERLNAVYWERGTYLPEVSQQVARVLRDHRTNEVHAIDPRLLDLLYALNAVLPARAPYQVISGYRSPMTNAMLHAASTGVAEHSLHTQGMAIDIRVPGVQLAKLRDRAKGLGGGGVGYYPRSDFVHVDVGRVRYW
jgi:uncharacterized protein YcbK (DUF882 family)